MANTYEPIQSYTLTSIAASQSFSSIPATYTDLILQCSIIDTTNGTVLYTRLNGDTGTNYSTTILLGNSASGAGAGKRNSSDKIDSNGYNYGMGSSSTLANLATFHFMNYANTSINKTALIRSQSTSDPGETEVFATAGLWRSNAAISSILVYPSSGSFASGSTFTLYGVKSA
jgi:hypothetical protein